MFLALGLLIMVASVLLPLLHWILIGLAVGVAVPGLVLLVLGWSFERAQATFQPAPEILQNLYSTDNTLRATIKQRNDGQYQVEYWALVYHQNAEHGMEPHYTRMSASTIADSLASAIDLANERLRAGM